MLNVLVCDFEGTPSGVSRTATIVVTADVPGVITNSAFVFGGSADPNFANNSASVTTTVGAGSGLLHGHDDR